MNAPLNHEGNTFEPTQRWRPATVARPFRKGEKGHCAGLSAATGARLSPPFAGEKAMSTNWAKPKRQTSPEGGSIAVGGAVPLLVGAVPLSCKI